MIRPFTLLTAALAIGSGYYLYQAKHRTRLLDDQITSVEQKTEAAETRIAVLRAEWALENSPSRLADLASRYLLLVPMQPSQAVSMADLASHLPPPAQPGATPPAVTNPDLPLIAGLPQTALYASLDFFAGPSVEAHPSSSPLAIALAPADSSSQPPAAPEAVASPARPTSVADLSAAAVPEPVPAAVVPEPARSTPAPPKPALPAALSGPAPAQTPPPRLTRPALIAAAPERLAPSRFQPAPVLTSALGGAYPNLPPPAPLSGSR